MMDADDLRRKAEELGLDADIMQTPLDDSTAHLHELYVSLKSNGFSTLEALWLIGYAFTGGSRNVGDS
jgi:hypothetical protein